MNLPQLLSWRLELSLLRTNPLYFTLTNAVPFCNQVEGRAFQYYRYTVHSNTAQAIFQIENTTGDVDLYLRHAFLPESLD